LAPYPAAAPPPVIGGGVGTGGHALFRHRAPPALAPSRRPRRARRECEQSV